MPENQLPPPTNESTLKYEESNEKAKELFRLTVSFLGKYQLSINPVNFGLAYHYVSNDHQLLNQHLNELLKARGKWPQNKADELFLRYVCCCHEVVLKDLRVELTDIVAHTLGTIIDLTGKTSVSNKKIEKHIDTLAASQKINEVMHAVSAIISETRLLVSETNRFEAELVKSTAEVEKLKAELSSAKQEAKEDSLTGVLNRGGFDHALNTMISEALGPRHTGFCLMLLDIDHFKVINDNHGHLLGDKVLKVFADLLEKHTKGKDVCARFGGDEFAILLPDIGTSHAVNLANNLRLTIQKVVLKRPNTGMVLGSITVSIGVAAYRFGESCDDLLQRCDKALYHAKSLGRNQVYFAK
jgi:diguanylate cyclase